MIKAGEKRSLACTTCAKAKARCIPGPSIANGRCERCHRLSKPCGSRTPAPPRAKNNIKRSRVAELEKRLSQLEGGGVTNAVASKSLASPAPSVEQSESQAEKGQAPTCFSSSNSPKATRKVDLLLDHIFPASQETSPWPSKESVELARKNSWESLWPLEAEAEIILGNYKAKLEKLFPFVIVPDLKAAELKQSRPFLWKAVMMVGTFLDGARNMKLGEELLADISHAAMVQGEHGLDILQGVQLLVAWFHHALKNSRLTNLLFLARSLCLSLGLGGNAPAANTNLDHLRAYAGTYYVNTLVFTTNKRTEVLMNTIFLDRCCSMLEQAKQLQTDEFLVKLVRVQQLAQTISLTVAMEPGQQAMQLPMTIVVQSFQDQLASLQQSLSPDLAENPMMMNHIAIAHVLLTEWAISDRHHSTSAMALTDRLRLLWSCARSLHSIFHVRKHIWEDLDNLKFLCLHGSDLSYALITGVRLVTLRLPGWSLEQIDQEMCFSSVMDNLITHLHRIVERRRAGAYSSSQGGNVANDPIEGLWNLCAGLRTKIKAEMARALAESKTEMRGFEAQPVDLLGMGLVDDLGSSYWKDFMTDAFWNGQGDTMGFDPQF